MTILANKIALITGASSGIGYAAAKLFAREGASLVLSGRRLPELNALVAEIAAAGGQAVAVAGDIRDQAMAKCLVDTALERFGGLDIAFNNAGTTGAMGPLSDMSLTDWQDTMDTNLTSAFLGAKYQIPALRTRGGGALIFTSSFVGHTAGMPDMAAYGASKAGIIGMTQCLAVELGASGIRVNALLPGGTDTPMSLANAPGSGPEVQAFLNQLHALKRTARPDEIARAALFLASESSSFVTGSAMLVDGGVSVNRT